MVPVKSTCCCCKRASVPFLTLTWWLTNVHGLGHRLLACMSSLYMQRMVPTHKINDFSLWEFCVYLRNLEELICHTNFTICLGHDHSLICELKSPLAVQHITHTAYFLYEQLDLKTHNLFTCYFNPFGYLSEITRLSHKNQTQPLVTSFSFS